MPSDALQAGAAARECIWTQVEEGYDSYETTCGHQFDFNDGGPVENSAKFCLYCGGALIEQKAEIEPHGE